MNETAQVKHKQKTGGECMCAIRKLKQFCTISAFLFSVVALWMIQGCATFDWNDAKKQNNSQAYEEFLVNYPDSAHASDARTALDNIRWNDAKQQNTIQAYEEFLKNYPNSAHVAHAKTTLDNICWRAASLKDSEAGYDAYIKKFPQGLHIISARKGMEDLDWAHVQSQRSIKSYETFLNEYPQSSYASEVKSQIYKIKVNSAWERARLVNTVKAYQRFIINYPESPHAVEASQFIEKSFNKTEFDQKRKKNKLRKDPPCKDKWTVFIIAREMAGFMHFIIRGNDNRYYKITESGFHDYELGKLIAPELKNMEPFECAIAFASMENLVDEEYPLKEIDNQIYHQLLELTEKNGYHHLMGSYLGGPDVINRCKFGEVVRPIFISMIKSNKELLNEVKDKNSTQRITAAKALGIMNAIDMIDDLKLVQKEDDLQLRNAVQGALNKIEACQYELAVEKDTISAYESFLKTFRKGKFNKEVHSKMETLYYKDAIEKETEKAYKAYLKRYPNGVHAKTINERLSDENKKQKIARERREFDRIPKTRLAMLSYLKTNPPQYWAMEAKQVIEDILIDKIIAKGPGDQLVISDIRTIKGEPSSRIAMQQIDSETIAMSNFYPKDSLSFSLGEGGVFTGRATAKIPRGDQSVYRFISKIEYYGYLFDSNEDEPLTFILLEKYGLVYLHGKGKVTLKNGKIVNIE